MREDTAESAGAVEEEAAAAWESVPAGEPDFGGVRAAASSGSMLEPFPDDVTFSTVSKRDRKSSFDSRIGGGDASAAGAGASFLDFVLGVGTSSSGVAISMDLGAAAGAPAFDDAPFFLLLLAGRLLDAGGAPASSGVFPSAFFLAFGAISSHRRRGRIRRPARRVSRRRARSRSLRREGVRLL
jgi:hypothetical protein